MLNESLSYYEILDLQSDASPQMVREAYIRAKSTFTKESVALYTLITNEEGEEFLKAIEQAYLTLSDPEKRREYDQNFGIISGQENPFDKNQSENSLSNIFSIDRIPPMESNEESEKLLIPPSTDFSANTTHQVLSTASVTSVSSPPLASNPHQEETPQQTADTPYIKIHADFTPNHARIKSIKSKLQSQLSDLDPDLLEAIDSEKEWKGAFIRRVREGFKMSLEEMSRNTKVAKHYITSIEEDCFEKLPAPVYIRSFVIQIARVLKLPHEKVASAYLERYHNQIKTG